MQQHGCHFACSDTLRLRQPLPRCWLREHPCACRYHRRGRLTGFLCAPSLSPPAYSSRPRCSRRRAGAAAADVAGGDPGGAGAPVAAAGAPARAAPRHRHHGHHREACRQPCVWRRGAWAAANVLSQRARSWRPWRAVLTRHAMPIPLPRATHIAAAPCCCRPFATACLPACRRAPGRGGHSRRLVHQQRRLARQQCVDRTTCGHPARRRGQLVSPPASPLLSPRVP
jgi:hypothetical protein